MANIQCDVVSAKESIYSKSVKMLIAKGEAGELGIMAGHTPLTTLLKPGPLQLQLDDGSYDIVYISGGVLEVQPHLITVLADTAVRANNLDEVAIEAARKEAEKALANQNAEMDIAMAKAHLAEMVGQLETIRKIKNRAGGG